jgi:hypothetical protein
VKKKLKATFAMAILDLILRIHFASLVIRLLKNLKYSTLSSSFLSYRNL